MDFLAVCTHTAFLRYCGRALENRIEMTATSTAHDSPNATERNGVRAEESAAHGAETADSTSPSLFSMLRQLWTHLPVKRRYQLVAVFASMLASGFAEIVSLGAVVPFLTVLVDPQRLMRQPWIRSFAEWYGLTEPAQLLLPMTLLFAGSAIAAGLIRLVNLWLSGRVAAGTGSDLSQEAYRRTLYQPYSVHVARNSAAITAAVLTHVDRLIYGVLHPLLLALVNAIVIASLALGLVLIDPRVAFLTALAFGGTYLTISLATSSSLVANGRQQATTSEALVQNVQEGLGAVRDVLLDRSQPYYLARYRSSDWSLRQLRARAELLGGFPRFVTEAAGIAGVAILAYALVTRQGGMAAALPVLGALALGAQRLLPALQQAYASFSQMQNHSASLASVLALLDQPAPASKQRRVPAAPFVDSITLDCVSFRYQPELPLVLCDVSLVIKRGERVAFVGPTGSGKSTLADIVMGLLEPTSGRFLVDGYVVAPESWQSNIAHVPQSIFLADTSIAENIAMGIPAAEVDAKRLKAAVRQAQISDFIESLPLGLETTVGERGVRLSGGQRQRIGIARALYKQPPVLVLDEATSALDEGTEKAFMNTLDRLSRDLTIIIIAHRLSTTAYCDRIITVADGSIRETIPARATVA
jgi:ABC-type multidrug transport system fused ATPase/permease subunit